MWLGRSVHSAQGARGAVGIDYLVGGSVFETESKPGSSRTLGQDGLRDIVLAAGDVPVWAIGGVRAEHLPSLAASGVRGVAVIGALIPVEGRESITKEVARRASELRFAFDTSAGVP
jgi:thiamine monophosphate synthase